MSTPARVPKNLLTQTSDPSGPNLIAGDTYFNSTAKAIRVYDGSAWVDFINDETAQTVAGAKTFTGGVVANSAITGNNTLNLTGTGTSSVAGTFTGTALIPSGLTGATQSSRYVGATTQDAPASGTFSTGDYVVARDGAMYVCTGSGSPGTWRRTGATAHRIEGGLAGTITVGTGKARFYLEKSYVFESVRISVNTAPTGATIIVDVNKNGTTIFTTQGNRPVISASAFTGTSTNPDVTTFASGDYITFDVDQIGSTVAGADLVCTLILRQA